MKYKNIEDFPANDTLEGYHELRAMEKIWQRRKPIYSNFENYSRFISRLNREWAIETGLVENLYSWSRGVTETLLQADISSEFLVRLTNKDPETAEEIANLIKDQLSVVDGLFLFVKNQQEISEHYIRQIHFELTKSQRSVRAFLESGQEIEVDFIRGQYKKSPNNVRLKDGRIHHYCPPEHVTHEMPRLISMFNSQKNQYAPEIQAAWLHHRFTQIHPFQDGNGRVARVLASIVFLRAGLMPLIIRDSDRGVYFDALESADSGNLQDLITLFGKRQKDILLSLLSMDLDPKTIRTWREGVHHVEDKTKKEWQASGDLEKLASLFKSLIEISDQTLAIPCEEIKRSLGFAHHNGSEYTCSRQIIHHDHPSAKKRTHSILEMLTKRQVIPDFEVYSAYYRFWMITSVVFEWRIYFFGINNTSELGGALSVAYIKDSSHDEDCAWLEPSEDAFFSFAISMDPDAIKNRYLDWLLRQQDVVLVEWARYH